MSPKPLEIRGQLITVREAEIRWGLGANTVSRWARRGLLRRAIPRGPLFYWSDDVAKLVEK